MRNLSVPLLVLLAHSTCFADFFVTPMSAASLADSVNAYPSGDPSCSLSAEIQGDAVTFTLRAAGGSTLLSVLSTDTFTYTYDTESRGTEVDGQGLAIYGVDWRPGSFSLNQIQCSVKP